MTANDTERRSIDRNHLEYDVLVVGGGAAGLSAAIFTARFGLETGVFACGRSAISRCGHLENYLGFPGGIDPPTFLELGREQVSHEGATVHAEMVTEIDKPDERFRVETIDGTQLRGHGTSSRRPSSTATTSSRSIRRCTTRTITPSTATTAAEPKSTDCTSQAGWRTRPTRRSSVCAGDGAKTAHALITDVLRDRGYWDEIASQYTDWVVRERPDDDWVPRVESWIRETVPEDGDVSEERVQWVIDDIVERFEAREISDNERRERVQNGREFITAHLEP